MLPSTQFKLLKLLVISSSLVLLSSTYLFAQEAEDTFTGEVIGDNLPIIEPEAPDLAPLPEPPPQPPKPKRSGLQAITVEQQRQRLGEIPPPPEVPQAQSTKSNKFEPPAMPTAKTNTQFHSQTSQESPIVPAPPTTSSSGLKILPFLDPLLNPPLPLEVPDQNIVPPTNPDATVELEPKNPIPSERTHGFYLLGSTFKPNLGLPNGLFSQQYKRTPVMFEGTLELFLLTGWFGTFGWRGNLLFWWADGQNVVGANREAMDLYIIGSNSSLALQLDFWDKQIVVPWAEIGFGQNLYYQNSGTLPNTITGAPTGGGIPDFHEIRDIWFYSVGGKILLDNFEPRNQHRLDIVYGVNHSYVMGMYREYFTNSHDFNFQGGTWLAGVNIEF